MARAGRGSRNPARRPVDHRRGRTAGRAGDRSLGGGRPVRRRRSGRRGRGTRPAPARAGQPRRALADPGRARRNHPAAAGGGGRAFGYGETGADGGHDGRRSAMTIETERLRSRVATELERTRERTALLTGSVDDDDLVRRHSPLMSPLVWDLAHVGNQEELWLVRDV